MTQTLFVLFARVQDELLRYAYVLGTQGIVGAAVLLGISVLAAAAVRRMSHRGAVPSSRPSLAA